MPSEAVLHRLAAEFDDPAEAIAAVVSLLESGAPSQFIARFRRDETSDLSEERVGQIEERLHFLQDLEARKESILQQATERGSDTETLRETLETTYDQDLLDDIYQSFRPRRRTAGVQAEERGLGPLAEAVHHRQLGDRSLQEVATDYISTEHELPTAEAVLEATGFALAERYAANAQLRAEVRDELSRGVLSATATAPNRKGAQRYKDFFNFEEEVRRINASRMLALRRAEREGIIKIELRLPEGRAREIFRRHFAPDLELGSQLLAYLDLVFEHAYEHLVRPACEADIRRRFKEKADRETVRTFSRSLRSQLLAPPLGHKRAMALRASSRTIWLVVLNEDGSVAAHETLHLEGGRDKAQDAKGKRKSKTDPAAAGDAATPAGDAETPPAPAESPAAIESTPAESTPAESTPAESAPAAGPAEAPTSAPAAEAMTTTTPPAAAEPPAPTAETAVPPAAPPAEAAAGAGSGLAATPSPEPAPEAVTPTTAPAQTATDGDAAPAATPSEAATTEGSGDTAGPSTPAAANGASADSNADDRTPPTKHHTREEAVERIAAMIRELAPAAIAIPHGRRQDISEKILRQVVERLERRPLAVPVDEATSAIYATSAAGRKAFPQAEVGIRTAISLARRLQDPLLELIAKDPRDLGLGQSLGDVHQGMLGRHLELAVASCLAGVGVDLNRADADALARLPGLNREQARAIVEFRRKNGGFRNLEQLKEVDGVDEATHRHVAGFLRISGGDEELDGTAVHPENYELARQVAAQLGRPITDVLGTDLRSVDIQPLLSATVGRKRVLDVLDGLSHHGRDPRGQLSDWTNEGVTKLADLQVDMQLRGRVTNVTEFGAFIDLGVGQDGLIHVSQIPPGRMRHPDRMLRVGEVVSVFVLKVDPESKRISLSMHRPRHLSEGRQPTLGERMQGGGRGNRGRRRGQEDQVMTRAARAPDGRRGDRRGPRRAPGGGGGGSGFGGRGGGRRDEAPRRRGGPRVITVESDKQVEESLGHKGEIRSLSGLRQLLTGPEPSNKTEDSGAAES